MSLFISTKGLSPFTHSTESEEKGTKSTDAGSSSLIPFELTSSHLEMKFSENVTRLILSLLLLKSRLFLNFVTRESGTGEGLFGSFECRLCGGI